MFKSAGKLLKIQTDITDYRGISYVTFLLNSYHCTICKSKLLSGTETSFWRALILNKSVTLVLKKELWVGTNSIGAGRAGRARGGGGVIISRST